VRPIPSFLSCLSSLACVAAIAAGVLVPRTARADDDASSDSGSSNDAGEHPGPGGLEAGMRIGYSLPMGQVTGDGTYPALSNMYSGVLPLAFDLGVRATPNLYFGGYFQYGFAFVGDLASSPGGASNCSSGVSCSGSVLALGVAMHYHFQPADKFDPWVGIGLGYEWANLSASQGNASAGLQVSGVQFLNLQVGGDFKTSSNVGFGPYAALSLGEYSNCGVSYGGGSLGDCSIHNQTLHEWVSLGVRAVFDTSP